MSDNRLHVIVRPMVLDDIDQVVELDRLSFPTPWPARTYRHEVLNSENSRMIVVEYPATLHRAQSHTVGLFRRLAGSEDRSVARPLIVAFSGYWFVADEVHISTIAVHPAWRGRKLGELLIWTMVRDAIRRGVAMVTLEVRVSNEIAQNLYRKYGFEVTGVRRGYYHDNGEDAYIMTLTPLDENCRAQLREFGRVLSRCLHVTAGQ